MIQLVLNPLQLLTMNYSNLYRILPQELGFAAFLFFCGLYDVLYGKRQYFVYVFLQVITFTIAGFGYIGTIVPS